MAQTSEGVKKQIQTMIKKHGSYENWVAALREYGRLGGSKEAHGNKPRGYQLNRELAVKNGRMTKRGTIESL